MKSHRDEIRDMVADAKANAKRIQVIKPCFKKREYALSTTLEFHYKAIISAYRAWEKETYGD